MGAARAAAAGALRALDGRGDAGASCGASAGGRRSRPALVSAWWVVPLLVQSRFGVDFLRFTEQPGTIWSTTSLPESLRLMGYWISYLGVGYGGELRPYFGDGGVLLFALPVVVAGLLVPALALTGFAWTPQGPLRAVRAAARARRPARHDGGLPGGHAAAPGVELHVQPLRPGPVPAHDLQGRAAGGARARGARRAGRRARARAGVAGRRARAAAGRVLAAGPRARASTTSCCGSAIPAAWQRRRRPRRRDGGTAAPSSCPASSTPTTTGAGRSTRSCPSLADTPVATRNAVGYADLRATDLLWTRRRARPAAARGARASSTRCSTCSARARWSPAPTTTAPAAARRPPPRPPTCSTSWARPTRPWGAGEPRPRAAGTLGAPRALPQVRAWDRPDAPGLVRVEPDRAGRSSSTAPPKGWPRSPRSGASADVAYAGDLTAAADPPAQRGRDHRLQPAPRCSCRRGWRRTPGRCWRPTRSRRSTPRC